MDGEILVLLPKLNRAHFAPEVVGDFLPGIQPVMSGRGRKRKGTGLMLQIHGSYPSPKLLFCHLTVNYADPAVCLDPERAGVVRWSPAIVRQSLIVGRGCDMVLRLNEWRASILAD